MFKLLFIPSNKDISIAAENLYISNQVFKELLLPIISKHLSIKKLRLVCNITQEEFMHLLYHLPMSYQISNELFEKMSFEISDEVKELIRKSISLYISLNSFTRINRNMTQPFLRFFNKSNADIPTLAWMRYKFPIVRDIKFSPMDIKIIQRLDHLFRNTINELELRHSSEMGRPKSGVEDYFMVQLKNTITLEYKHYRNKIYEINELLRNHQHHLFESLPVSESAIKQAIERAEENEKKINNPEFQDQKMDDQSL